MVGNLEHFLDPNFYPPQIGDKDYEQFLHDDKFVYSVFVELVMNPNHEARYIILTDDVEENGKVAWVKLIGHYDNETIEKSLLSSLYNRWNSLRLHRTNLGAAKSYITNYASLLNQMKDEGAPVDENIARIMFLDHISAEPYQTVVLDCQINESDLVTCYERIGRVAVTIEGNAARRKTNAYLAGTGGQGSDRKDSQKGPLAYAGKKINKYEFFVDSSVWQ